MPPAADPLLHDVLNAPNDKEFARRLQRLLQDHVSPLVAGIIQGRLGISPLRRRGLFHSQQAEDAEDIYQEAISRVGARLNQERSSLHQLTNLMGYVAVTTYRAFYAHLRRKYPARSQLKDEIRRVLNREPDLAAWAHATVWVGGRATWRKQADSPTNSPRLQSLCADPAALPIYADGGPVNSRLLRLPDLLRAFFHWFDHPVELDTLTTLTAQQWGLNELQIQSLSETERADESPGILQVADDKADVPTIVARNALFARLWEQISQLPPIHCAALLLNFKEGGECLVVVFTDLQIATRRQIAAAMGLPMFTLDQIWDDIPLEDNAIAELLDITRQKVINCRAAARERLQNRADQIW